LFPSIEALPQGAKGLFSWRIGPYHGHGMAQISKKTKFQIICTLCTMGQGFIDEENNFVENIYLKVSSRRLFLKRTVYGKCNKMGLFTSHSFDLDPCCV